MRRKWHELGLWLYTLPALHVDEFLVLVLESSEFLGDHEVLHVGKFTLSSV